ncbi:MAG: oxidase [Planctomycetota bacterium]|nr:MAG: oxidase [Planctomycetota bacterium]
MKADHTVEEHQAPYGFIFGLLCVFTAVSWLADELKGFGLLTNWYVIAVIVMAVAAAKAMCVMLYFMHLKFEQNWKYVLLAPTIILAVGIPLALLPDIGLHYYVVADRPAVAADVVGHGEHGHDGGADEHADGGEDNAAAGGVSERSGEQ